MAASEAPQAPSLQLWGVPSLLPAPAAQAVAFGPERRFQLLLLLALERGQWLDRDRIAALLWPAHALPEARRNLRKVVFRARAVPGAQALESNDHALRWDVTTDLQALLDACRRGDAAHGLALRRGPPLQGVDDPGNGTLAEVLAAARARIDEVWLNAAHEQLRAQTEPPAQAAAARRILEVDPLDEPAIGALLQAERSCGRPAEAQAAYRRYATRLVQELGVEPSHALRDLVHGAPAPAGVEPALPPLRRASDAFVGRRLELAEAQALLTLPACRALTLLGPGGIGKSRLAQQLMARCAAQFAGGAYWVALQDTAQLPAALASLAQALGITTQDTGDPIDQLLRQLPQERLLLVLDNAEHLGELAAALQRLLDGAPAVVLLLTSRSRLHLRDEWVLPLPGLAVPDEDSRDLEAAASFDAVRLFEQCAHAAQRDFVLARHLPAVIAIVEAVGGMPLAIELAAGWVRLLPPEQVALDLRGSIDLLERDPASHSAPARSDHTSLRAVLDGTWRLLAPREREALARLAVFEGGFMRAAAQAVAACSLPLLSSLVDKSLLTVDEAGRFSLHPVVAAYAAERHSEDAARAAQLAVRHAAYFAEAVALPQPRSSGDARARLATVDRELANLLVALRNTIDRGPDAVVCALVSALRGFYESRGRLLEGLGVLRPLLAAPWLVRPAARRAQAELRAAVAWMLYRKGDFRDARAIAEPGIAAAKAARDPRLMAGCLRALASSQSALGNPGQARPHFEQALALYREAGDRPAIATTLGDLGVVEKRLGNYAAALVHYRAALEIDREMGEAEGIAIRLNNIANVHMEQDDWARAQQSFEDGLRQLSAEAAPWLTVYLEYGLGVTTLELGAQVQAQRHLEAARRRATAANLPHMAVAATMALARVAATGGRLGEGLRGLRAAALACAGLDGIEDRLSLALYYGEWLRAAGRGSEAGLAWRVVMAHAEADAGLRRTAQRWTDALTAADQALAGQGALDARLDDVLDALQDEPPWREGPEDAPASGKARETPPA